MDHNDDFPLDLPTRDPPPPLEPILESCVITTNRVRCRDGTIQIFTDRVIVKNGQSAPFNLAGNFVDENDDDRTDISFDNVSDEENSRNYSQQQNEIAYLIGEDIRDAIYGRVIRGTVLRRSSENDIWTETDEECAIKEMPWERIRNGQDRSSENPKDEIAAMQHLMRFYTNDLTGQQVSATTAIRRTRIIMPLDFLYDHQNLYTITPYCAGGELYDLLDMSRQFTEEESRQLLSGILDGVEWLQRAGLTHKDIRLENIMVSENMTVIIDMGMCLRIPFLDDEQANEVPQPAQRCLMNSRPRCGKLKYMAPEVYSQQPFDGYAVDMWAVGVCLFIMLTGREPWNRPFMLDHNFRNFTNEVSYDTNLSADAIDLLKWMLFLDPRKRLSVQQVRRHPWMT